MEIFHVIAEGHHPNNRWTRREDGLYELNGSVYAFTDEQVKRCTATSFSARCVCHDWHVYASGEWMTRPLSGDCTGPVNVYVTPERMAPVVYRHRAAECRGNCPAA